MSRGEAPSNLGKLSSLRIGNLPEDMKLVPSLLFSKMAHNSYLAFPLLFRTELIYQDFEVFGKIGDFYRPTNLQRGLPSRYAFVRYYNRSDADKACMDMHGKRYGSCVITVEDSNLQNSYFTQDTGFITNTMFDTPKVVEYDFNSALPPDHFTLKRKEQLKSLPLDQQITLRVDDLHKDISKEKLEAIFSEFGEVTSIYYPMDLKARIPRGFAFVRYSNQRSADRAIASMHDANLGVGRNIQVALISSKTYLSQDESGTMRFAQSV